MQEYKEHFNKKYYRQRKSTSLNKHTVKRTAYESATIKYKTQVRTIKSKPHLRKYNRILGG